MHLPGENYVALGIVRRRLYRIWLGFILTVATTFALCERRKIFSVRNNLAVFADVFVLSDYLGLPLLLAGVTDGFDLQLVLDVVLGARAFILLRMRVFSGGLGDGRSCHSGEE